MTETAAKGVSAAPWELHKAVADWRHWLSDDRDQNHLRMAHRLLNGVRRCAHQLDANGDIRILNVVGNLVETCEQIARELDEPIPEQEQES